MKTIRLCLVGLLSMTSHLANATVEFIGVAYHPKDYSVLYKEIHCQPSKRLGSSKVIYLDINDRIFANKTIQHIQDSNTHKTSLPSYFQKRWVPEYRFTHASFGFSESLSYEDNKIKLSSKPSSESKETYTKLNLADKAPPTPMIADAGFDQFIKDNIERITENTSIEVNYLSAPRLTQLGFDIQLSDSNEETLIFTLQPSSFLIRLLLEPIKVVYEREPLRLLRFEGLTNVPETRNKNFSAIIQYHYDSSTFKDKQINDLC